MVVIDKQGPYGSNSQQNWCLELNGCERIVAVKISLGSIINGVCFDVADAYGRATTKWFGGRFGTIYSIKLRSNEYITNISGTYGMYSYSGYDVITSLRIHTNLCPTGYGPDPDGEADLCTDVCNFSTHARRGSLVGFFGRCGQHLESIGIYVRRVI